MMPVQSPSCAITWRCLTHSLHLKFIQGKTDESLSASLPAFNRSPALIGCFVVDREYFEEIGLLDEGMEVYGGENVELGIRVKHTVFSLCKHSLFLSFVFVMPFESTNRNDVA